MKKLIFMVLTVSIISLFWVSCSKESHSESITSNTSTFKNRINNGIPSHNQLLGNMLEKLEDSNYDLGIENYQTIYNSILDENNIDIPESQFSNVFNNPYMIRLMTKTLIKRSYYNEFSDLSQFPEIIKNLVLHIESEMPIEFNHKLKENYQKLISGEINGSNYQDIYNQTSNELLITLGSEHTDLIELYRSVSIETYQFWMNDCQECLGNYSSLGQTLVLGDEWDDDIPAIDDNDWPNNAKPPVWLERDVWGALGGFFGGAGWGAIAVGACASAAP